MGIQADSLDDSKAELCSESLKIIFNLLLSNEKPANFLVDEVDDMQLQRDLVKMSRKLLLVKSNKLKKLEELKR